MPTRTRHERRDSAGRGRDGIAQVGHGAGHLVLEAPLKFRAPGLDLRPGLAIGRIVFRAFNVTEVGWAVVIVLAVITRTPAALATAAGIVLVAALTIQLGDMLPRLNRRSDQVLAGAHVSRSSSHDGCIALEILKVIGLIVLAVAALSG